MEFEVSVGLPALRPDAGTGILEAEGGAALCVGLAADEGALACVASLEGGGIALLVARAADLAGALLADGPAVAKEEDALPMARASGEDAIAPSARMEEGALGVVGAGALAGALEAALPGAAAIGVGAALDTASGVAERRVDEGAVIVGGAARATVDAAASFTCKSALTKGEKR